MPVERELPLRVVLREPPAGVRFALQCGPTATRQLVPPSLESASRVTFELTVRVRAGGAPPRFLGPFVHGPPTERFLYVNAGDHAGDAASPWSRRAKIRLDTIAAADVDAVLARPGAVLEAEIAGTSRDGGPVCATAPLLGGWRVVARG